jgi:biotin carboxyl carrier protein
MERTAMEIIKWDKEKKIVFLKDQKGTIYKAKIVEISNNEVTVYVFNTNQTYKIPLSEQYIDQSVVGKKQEAITTPISGRVINVHVQAEDHVLEGQPLVTIESMKMENEIRAPFDLFVKSVHISPGDLVEQDQLLIQIKVGEEV